MVQFAIICINFAVQKIQKALGKPQFKVKEIPEASLCEKRRFFYVMTSARLLRRFSGAKKKSELDNPKAVVFSICVYEIKGGRYVVQYGGGRRCFVSQTAPRLINGFANGASLDKRRSIAAGQASFDIFSKFTGPEFPARAFIAFFVLSA